MKITEITVTGDVAPFLDKLQTSKDTEVVRRIKKALTFLDVETEDDEDEIKESVHNIDLEKVTGIKEKVLDGIQKGDTIMFHNKQMKISNISYNYLKKQVYFELNNGSIHTSVNIL